MSKKVNKFKISKSSSQEQRIKDALKLLGFGQSALSLDEINKMMAQSKATYFDFIESLLENELAAKEENRMQSWIKRAKFPWLKTLKEFDFSFQPALSERDIKELASCRFIENAENVAFFGQTGVGKTHLSIAIGYEAIQNGFDVLFVSLSGLQESIEARINDGEALHKLSIELQKPKLLILDEMDLYESTPTVSIFLSKLLNDRHLSGSIIFTANQSFGTWGKLFGNAIRAETILDRIIGNCSVIEIKGPSYRTKDKLERLNVPN